MLRYQMNGVPETTTADGNGNYSAIVSRGWSGIITPYKTGYTFTPENKTYSNLQSNQVNQNYTAQVCANCADVNVLVNTSSMGFLYAGCESFDDYELPQHPERTGERNEHQWREACCEPAGGVREQLQ